MSGLTITEYTLPPTPPGVVEKLEQIERQLMGNEPADVPTDHLIHAGMYVRTILIPKEGLVVTGALVKRATVVILTGSVGVMVGEEWIRFDGYHVLPASAGRKQAFRSFSPVIITMMFPTAAKTVEEAEAEFTDDCDRLLSRRQDANSIRITGG